MNPETNKLENRADIPVGETLARLRRIEAAATRVTELAEAETRAQDASRVDSYASPTGEAPTRSMVLDAQRELHEAVRS